MGDVAKLLSMKIYFPKDSTKQVCKNRAEAFILFYFIFIFVNSPLYTSKRRIHSNLLCTTNKNTKYSAESHINIDLYIFLRSSVFLSVVSCEHAGQ